MNGPVKAALMAALFVAVGLAACGKVGPPSPPGPPDQVIYPRGYPVRPKPPAPAPAPATPTPATPAPATTPAP